MEKVYAYLRVSSPGQIPGDGFNRQLTAVNDYAASHNMKIVATYREEGITGTMESRPELARLMVSLEQNGHGIKCVLIESLSRIARDLMVQEAIIADFRKHGFTIISAMEGVDLCDNDPSRKAMRQMFGVWAEYEKVMLVLKLRAARERIKAKTGKCEGNKGYKDSPEGLAIMDKISALRRKPRNGRRLTWQQIADSLNESGIKTLDGKQWSFQRVQQTNKSSK